MTLMMQTTNAWIPQLMTIILPQPNSHTVSQENNNDSLAPDSATDS